MRAICQIPGQVSTILLHFFELFLMRNVMAKSDRDENGRDEIEKQALFRLFFTLFASAWGNAWQVSCRKREESPGSTRIPPIKTNFNHGCTPIDTDFAGPHEGNAGRQPQRTQSGKGARHGFHWIKSNSNHGGARILPDPKGVTTENAEPQPKSNLDTNSTN